MLLYVVIVLVIGLLDTAVGAKISLWVLYLLPIGLCTWNRGLRSGAVLVLLSTAMLIASRQYTGEPPHELLAAAIHVGSRIAVFFVVLGLVAALRRREVERLIVPTRLPGDGDSHNTPAS